MKRSSLVALGATLFVSMTPLAASAQANYRLAPVGGRTTVLGGTGVVYGQDAAAAFLNPATAVLADDRRLSFSVNFYSFSYMNAPRWYQPGPIDRERFGDVAVPDATMTDIEFNALPSSLCLFFRVGDVPFLVAKTSATVREREARLGFCFAAVQSQTWNFAAEGFPDPGVVTTTRQAQSLSQSYTRYSAGPTYAMNVNDHLAIGASLHFSFASHRSLMTSTSKTTRSTDGTVINSFFYSASRGDAFQITGVAGATYALGRQKVGIALEPPSLHIYGRGGANRHADVDGTGTTAAIVTAEGSFASQSPLRVSLGSGFEREWGLFEFNASYTAERSRAYRADLTDDVLGTPIDISERARGVVNFAAGAEVYLTPKVSVLGGASTDFSSVPKGALKGGLFNYYPARTNRLAVSAGVASHGAGGDLVVGTELSYGWGERIAVNSYQAPPDFGTTEHHTYQVLLTVAGSTTLRAIKRAVDDVREVVVPKKKHDDQK